MDALYNFLYTNVKDGLINFMIFLIKNNNNKLKSNIRDFKNLFKSKNQLTFALAIAMQSLFIKKLKRNCEVYEKLKDLKFVFIRIVTKLISNKTI